MTEFVSKSVEMTDSDFRTIASYIEENVGIKMPPSKRIMMQSRLIGRLRSLGISSYSDYIEYVFHEDRTGKELILLTDALTTNKTEFFRENDHFTFLSKTVLPELARNGIKTPKIWSAGCSSGEEVYTLSIVLSEYMRHNRGSFNGYRLFASDISTKVLDKAVNAVYEEESIADIPYELKKLYFLKSSDPSRHEVRIKPEIRSCISFRRLNFMDSTYNVDDMFQAIFCRNVLIYFDKPTQENIIRKLIRNLVPG